MILLKIGAYELQIREPRELTRCPLRDPKKLVQIVDAICCRSEHVCATSGSR